MSQWPLYFWQKSVTYKPTDRQDEATDLLINDVRNTLLYGGSRSGKTFLFCRALAGRAILGEGSRHVILRKAFNHVKTSIWMDTLPKVMEICFPHERVHWNRSDFLLQFYRNDSEIWIGGLDDKERVDKILGKEYATIYYNEASQLTYDSFTTAQTRLAQKTSLLNKTYVDCNPPPKLHWLYKVFFEGVDPNTKEKLRRPENYQTMLMNPIDNLINIDPEYLETLKDLPKRQRDRFLHGLFLDSFEGALWNIDMIKYERIPFEEAIEQCVKLIVAIDPAVTANATSDETGIVVVGKRLDGTFLVIADYSGQHTAATWAKIAVNLYHKYKADYIIGEVNNGGDLVERSIKFEDKSVKFKQVRATRGKFIRAEPISGLYERDLVRHIQEFTLLEDQMCQFVPEDMVGSPDRLDALVWGLTELADAQEIVIRIR